MAWSRYQFFLAGMMVVTGSINTLATKWADISKAKGNSDKEHTFDHPFLQALGMFLGEFTCLIAFKIMYFKHMKEARRGSLETGLLSEEEAESRLPASIAGNRHYSPFIFLLPALCDMTATSTMYLGLNLTFASSFQMLRGSLIVFTGIMSVIFLKRKLKAYQWVGIVFVIIGLVVVGLSDLMYGSSSSKSGANSQIIGDLLIIFAQVLTATQMVLEEKFVSGKNVSPLEAVGWEGFFGFTILGVLLVPMYYIPGGGFFDNPRGTVEDAIDGFMQIGQNWQILCGILGTLISIAFFNFAGVSVTKELSATTRTVLDSVRTLVIWLFGLAVSWQKFSYLQLIGFAVLLLGMSIYNKLISYRIFTVKRGCGFIWACSGDIEYYADGEQIPENASASRGLPDGGISSSSTLPVDGSDSNNGLTGSRDSASRKPIIS